MSGGFDWPALMRAGLHRLRLNPETFWALTPAELQVMLGANPSNSPLLRAGLEALMSAYPDTQKENEDARR